MRSSRGLSSSNMDLSSGQQLRIILNGRIWELDRIEVLSLAELAVYHELCELRAQLDAVLEKKKEFIP